MKKQILISLILLTVFCVAPVRGQAGNDFVTEAVKFNNLKIPADKKELFLTDFFKPLLTTGGSVEFDERNRAFIFNDTQNRVEFIKRFRNVLESSGLAG